MKKNYKSVLLLVIFILFLILILIHSSDIGKLVTDYSLLFLTKLFPASFLFFLFSSLFIEYGLIEMIQYYFHFQASQFYVLFISLISGFPAGAKCIKELTEADIIDSDSANKMILFSHFPNPLFVFGSVGSVIGNYHLTLYLYLSIILSNIIIFLLQRYPKVQIKNTVPSFKDFSSVLGKSIMKSFQTILLIYGTSLFFYLMITLIIPYFSLTTYQYVFLNGLFDLTKGVFATELLHNSILRVLFILFFIQFGGISIHMQVKGILANSSISYYSFVKGRIVSTILSFFIFLLLGFII